MILVSSPHLTSPWASSMARIRVVPDLGEIFSIIKMNVLHFYQVNLTGGIDFLNTNGAEIGYRVKVLKK